LPRIAKIAKKEKQAREKGPKENCAIVAKIEGLAGQQDNDDDDVKLQLRGR